VQWLREIGAAAADVGVRLAIEPMREANCEEWTIVTSLEQTLELIDEVGDPSIGIVYDTWHLWNSRHIVESTRRFAGRIAGVQVRDYREPRVYRDRMIPGEGVANIPALLAALEEGGYRGWYDLEVISEELWDLPPDEFARRSVEGLLKTWDARRAFMDKVGD